MCKVGDKDVHSYVHRKALEDSWEPMTFVVFASGRALGKEGLPHSWLCTLPYFCNFESHEYVCLSLLPIPCYFKT